MVTIGFVIVVGLPFAVLVAAVVWPQRVSSDHTAKTISRRAEAEGSRCADATTDFDRDG